MACKPSDRLAARRSGTRQRSKIIWIVIHSAEALSARGVASYFADAERAQGSTHAVVDYRECLLTLPELYVPWAAPGANLRGWHVELCGYARWTRTEWLASSRMLELAAAAVAARCRRYGIPARWVGPWGLRTLRPGLTTHADVSRAFRRSDHWDPGPNFPKDVFLDMVRRHMSAGGGGARNVR